MRTKEKFSAETAGMTEYGHEFAEHLLYAPSGWEKDSGIWPVRAGTNVAKTNYRVGPKIIEWYSLHAVRSGKVSLSFGTETVELEKGDMFCLFPGVTYDYKIVPSCAPLLLGWAAFNGGQSRWLLELGGLKPQCPYARSAYKGEAREAFEELLGQFRCSLQRESGGTGSYLKLVSLLYRLFDRIEAQRQHPNTAPKQNEWVERSEAFMRTHFMEGISVDDAAKHAGVSRSHFSVVFTRQTGDSPMRFLQKLRMEKAAGMLQESALPVTEIALSLGYPDLFAFTRAFSRYYGLPPSKFRESNESIAKYEDGESTENFAGK
ncbi:AraC family transcriptional regulator [Paenibacillus sp. MBLB4367]|uniref:AraC family transcriptional regulator n=1 Tax=Paenibacillus sp. MBLB4367 TaxID=3384767 RepID=UPI00390840A1